MDNELAPNDPYRGMESAEDEVRPDFLNKGQSVRETGKQLASKAALKVAEKAAGVPLPSKSIGGKKEAKESEEEGGGGLYRGGGREGKSKEKSFMKSKAMKFSVVAIVAISVMVMAASFISSNIPSFLIGHLDLNLQDSLFFTDTSLTLEKQARYITQQALLKGEVPKAHADDLAMHGIEVGQVTLAGDFVKTNVYLADLDNNKVASNSNDYYVNSDDGELAVRFDNQIIKASEFVATIESNPKMYAEYSEALNISGKFYYSDEVNEVYDDMGVSRGSFNDFEVTGDEEKDWENFNERLAEVLDEESSVDVNGYSGDDDEEEGESENNGSGFTVKVDGEDAGSIVNAVGSETKGTNATAKASQLLNAAISSSEPYKAAKAFIAIEEPIQRARIDGDGPVNEVMRALNEEQEVSYENVYNSEMTTQKKSILTTDNFVAAVSGGGFNKNEAMNFSRDRVLTATNSEDSTVVNDSTVATDGQKRSNILIKNGSGDGADLETLSNATDSLSIAVTEKNSELFKSVVGGNRIIEGGSFIANSINSRVIGAMPSDAGTIARYQREVNEELARKAEGERATKSPFDISSKYTFLGSIVHNFASSFISSRKSVSDGFSRTSFLATIAKMTDKSTDGLFGSVRADGSSKKYAETFGKNCTTVNSAATSEGDIYCTSINTISTAFMRFSLEDWKTSAIGNELTDSGEIKDKYDGTNSTTGMKDFIDLGMERLSTVGVQSSEVCERWKDNHENFLNKIGDAISSAFGLYESCKGIDSDVSIGSKYALSDSNSNAGNVEYYSGYALFDEVSSLISGETSNVAKYKKEYYKKHPVDKSPEGRLARISGLTKDEAKIAMGYANYLIRIAKYNPKLRFAFGRSRIAEPKKIKFVNDEKIEQSIYLAWFGKVEYSDVRNQNFVV
ncbi:hypothetical protein IKD82_00615 [Candidatus Saccharibacteria bacterium]|nr:hypothetical protein [Candidatus Saccharibacteria bacterium]